MPQLAGGAILCGIGSTMSLSVNDLGFRGGETRLAVFAGPLPSAAAGLLALAPAARPAHAPLATSGAPDRLHP